LTRKNSIALVALGIVIGAAATGILFTLLSGDRPNTMEIADREMRDASEPEPPGYSPEIPQPFTRDIKGNCTFSGTVLDPQGTAIENALVRLRLLDQPWSSPDPPIEMKTGKDGRFQISGLNEKLDFQLWVWAPKYGVASHNQIPCESHMRLALDNSASLELLFTNSDGDPVGPTKIQLIGSDLWPARQGYSSPNGKLTIHGLKAGEYTIWADVKELAYLSVDPIQLEQGKEKNVTLVLTPSSSAKVVVVDKAGGNPVEGATVLVGLSSTYLMHKTAMTGKDGSAFIPSLPQRNYVVTVIADGFRTSTPVPIRLDDENLIALDVGIAVSGTVRTLEGSSISQAILEVKKSLGKSLVQLPTGRGEALRRRILNAASSGWPRLYEVQAGSYVPGPTNIPIPVDSSYTIAKPKPNRERRQTTDKNGRFHLEGLPSGKVALLAHHPDFVMANRVEVTLEQGKNLAEIDLVMRPGTTLSVRILDERGFPIHRAEVDVFNRTQERIATATSDPKGVAAFTGLPGIFRIESTADGYVPAVKNLRVRTGTESDATLTLPDADKLLRGRVLDQHGFGIPGAMVSARSNSKGLLHAVTGLTESDGTFVLEGVGSGGYHVIADAGEQGRAQVPDAYFDTAINLVVSTERNLAKPASVTSETVALPADSEDKLPVPFEETDLIGSDEESDFPETASADEEDRSTINTRFGEAEKLPVTDTPPGKGSLPISIGGVPGNIIVTHIRPGSRVAMAGLSKGDRIVAINNRKMLGPAAARRALSGPIGSVVTMTIKNKGEQFTVIVQRVRVK
jgi:protocatechuate 3,4-dioxygenase beta subunit